VIGCRKRRSALLAGAIAFAANARAFAAEPRDPPPPPPPADEARGWETPPSNTPEDAALFVPRVLLLGPRLVLTAVFFPIREGLRAFSRRQRANEDAPTAYATRKITALPHLSYLSGFGTTFGLAGRYENLAGYGEDAWVTAAVGGRVGHAAEVGIRADRLGGRPIWLESRTRYAVLTQEVFQGIGDGDGNEGTETRYRDERLTALGRGGVTVGEKRRLVRIGGSLIFDRSSFSGKTYSPSNAPSIEALYDTSTVVGFDRGVRTLEAQANLFVDTRDETAATSNGILAAGYVGIAPAFDRYGYGHLGADVTGTIDLYKGNRLLVLRGAFESVHGTTTAVPFARLPRLGGPTSLRGYLADRFRDRESALASAEYRYPIHDLVAGALFIDAGHVAPDPAGLTAFHRWRVGGGFGLRVRTKDDTLVTFDFAVGDGAQVYLSIFPFESRGRWSKP
jgi:hypothetical protein